MFCLWCDEAMALRTGNPTLKESTFATYRTSVSSRPDPSTVMTLDGTVHRTFFLLCLVTGSAGMIWGLARTQPELMLPALIGGALASLVLCLITVFIKQWSPITAPMSAVAEGLSLGVISYLYEAFGLMVTLIWLYLEILRLLAKLNRRN